MKQILIKHNDIVTNRVDLFAYQSLELGDCSNRMGYQKDFSLIFRNEDIMAVSSRNELWTIDKKELRVISY